MNYSNNQKALFGKDKLNHLERNLNDQNLVEFKKIIIIIHNIDGKNLLQNNTQYEISRLANLEKVNFIVSFDHVRYLTILNTKTIENFDFIFNSIHTYQYYGKEICSFNDQELIDSNTRKFRALQSITKSLSKIQIDIIETIAKIFIEFKGKRIDKKTLYFKCIDDNMINDTTLEENLKEILDHKIIEELRDEKTNKIYFRINYEIEILEKIVSGELEEK